MDRSPGLFRAILELRALRALGTWSFSLYLWQQPFYMMVHRDGLPAPLALASSLGVGVTAFYLVEKPARTWLNRVLTAKLEIPSDENDSRLLQP
jgi:peptidoglycan/LPS O-acetylase OafA/YrhL